MLNTLFAYFVTFLNFSVRGGLLPLLDDMLNMYRDIFSGWSGTGFGANLVDFQSREDFREFSVQCGLVSIFMFNIKPKNKKN